MSDQLGDAGGDARGDLGAPRRPVGRDVLSHIRRRGEVGASERAAPGAAELSLGAPGELVAEVHHRVEGVELVGEGIPADGHRADHPQHPGAAVLDLSQCQAERYQAGGERAVV
jgi:hypothetical protein